MGGGLVRPPSIPLTGREPNLLHNKIIYSNSIMARKRNRRRKGGKATVAKLSKQVKAIRNAEEVKDLVTSQTTLTVGSITLNRVHISAIAAGTSYNQRVGRDIQPKFIRLRFHVRGSDAQVGPMPFRVWLIQVAGDDIPIDPTANNRGTSLLESYDETTDSNMNSTSSFYNSDYVYNSNFHNNKHAPIRVLWDSGMKMVNARFADVAPGAAGWGGENPGTFKTVHAFIPAKKLREVQYQGTGSGSVSAGGLYLAYIVGNSTTGANNPSFAYNCYLGYTDS